MSPGRTTIPPRSGVRRLELGLATLGLLLLAAIPVALLVDRNFFTGIDLAGDNTVMVHVGAKRSVIVHANRNVLGRVTTRVRSGSLVIGTTPGNLAAKTPMFVAVSVHSLDRVRLEGDGNISVTGIDSEGFTVVLRGNGNIDAAGTATNLDVALTGHGNALLRRLIARDARAALSGEGSIMLTATQSLTARLPGTGTILYGGNPSHVRQRVTGSGVISAG